MAKASRQDLDRMMELIQFLESVESGYLPDGPASEEDPRFDDSDFDCLSAFYKRVMSLYYRGGALRCVLGFQVILDNPILDPHKSYIDYHPRLIDRSVADRLRRHIAVLERQNGIKRVLIEDMA